MNEINFKKFYLLGFIMAICLLHLPKAEGANILGVFTSHSTSHLIVHMSIVRALAERGHNITVVSSIKPLSTLPNIKHIIIPPTKEQEQELNAALKEIANKRSNMLTMVKSLFSMGFLVTMQYDALKDDRFTQLYDQKFDLIIWGYFFNDFQLGIAKKFNCPIIVSWMGSPISMINNYIGNPMETAYVPNSNVAVKAGEPMDFTKRLQNFFSAGFMSLFSIAMNIWMKSYYKELFPRDNFPTYEDIKKNVSLVFCNSHFTEGAVRPNVPAIVEIGGIQIKETPDPLPKDIADFLNSADKDGAILFCLGSNLKGSNINPEIVQIIFKTLSSLKQKVIWKWEDLDHTPGKSPNILYKKWLPQDDILAHPNIKLFITHAGKGGIAEAQYHGVPMVALPVFAEQPDNAEKMVVSGYGRKLDLLILNEKDFKYAISEVLGNPIYKENIKQFSKLYQDRPISAKESVVYWTEYVLRHHGAAHMQSPLVHLNFLQSLCLDVIGTLLLVTYIVCKVIKMCFKFILKKFKLNKGKTVHKKIKKN